MQVITFQDKDGSEKQGYSVKQIGDALGINTQSQRQRFSRWIRKHYPTRFRSIPFSRVTDKGSLTLSGRCMTIVLDPQSITRRYKGEPLSSLFTEETAQEEAPQQQTLDLPAVVEASQDPQNPMEALFRKMQTLKNMEASLARQMARIEAQEAKLQKMRESFREKSDSLASLRTEIQNTISPPSPPQNPWTVTIEREISAQVIFDAVMEKILDNPMFEVPSTSEEMIEVAAEYLKQTSESEEVWWHDAYREFVEEDQSPPLPHNLTPRSVRDLVRHILPKAPGKILIPADIA